MSQSTQETVKRPASSPSARLIDSGPACACVHADPITCARLRDNNYPLDPDDDEAPRRSCECVCHDNYDEDDCD
jgi:hypothetical protein